MILKNVATKLNLLLTDQASVKGLILFFKTKNMVHITKFVLSITLLTLLMTIYYTACNQPIDIDKITTNIETQPEDIEPTIEPDYTEPLNDTFEIGKIIFKENKIPDDYIIIISEDENYLTLEAKLHKKKILPQHIDSVKNCLDEYSIKIYNDFYYFINKHNDQNN